MDAIITSSREVVGDTEFLVGDTERLGHKSDQFLDAPPSDCDGASKRMSIPNSQEIRLWGKGWG